jgi:hypothetical protein
MREVEIDLGAARARPFNGEGLPLAGSTPSGDGELIARETRASECLVDGIVDRAPRSSEINIVWTGNPRDTPPGGDSTLCPPADYGADDRGSRHREERDALHACASRPVWVSATSDASVLIGPCVRWICRRYAAVN